MSMPLPPPARYSVDELARYVRADGPPSDVELAAILDTNVRCVSRWRANGGLTVWQADSMAARAGTHPAMIWPDWWYAFDDRDDEEAAA